MPSSLCEGPMITRGGCTSHSPDPQGNVSHLSGPPGIGGGQRRPAAPPPAPMGNQGTYSGRAICVGGTSIEVAAWSPSG